MRGSEYNHHFIREKRRALESREKNKIVKRRGLKLKLKLRRGEDWLDRNRRLLMTRYATGYVLSMREYLRGLRRRRKDTQEMDRQGLVSHSGRFGHGSYIPYQSSGIHTRNALKKDRKKHKDYRSMTRKRPSHLVSYIKERQERP